MAVVSTSPINCSSFRGSRDCRKTTAVCARAEQSRCQAENWQPTNDNQTRSSGNCSDNGARTHTLMCACKIARTHARIHARANAHARTHLHKRLLTRRHACDCASMHIYSTTQMWTHSRIASFAAHNLGRKSLPVIGIHFSELLERRRP